jgi:hypothetical protein
MNEDIVRKYEKYTYIMKDAFDPTINVARVIKKTSKEEKMTKEIYAYTLE